MDKRLKIKEKKDNNEYILEDLKTGEIYSLILEFYDISMPKVNDTLVLSEKLLDKKSSIYCQPYAFTLFNNDFKDIHRNDIAGLITSSEKIVLKRIYG